MEEEPEALGSATDMVAAGGGAGLCSYHSHPRAGALGVSVCESDLEVKGGWALSKSAALVWGIESAFLRKFPGDTAASGQGTHLENH